MCHKEIGMARTIEDSSSGLKATRRRLLTGAGAGVALLAASHSDAHGVSTGRVCNVMDHGVTNDGADCTAALRAVLANPSFDVFYFPAGQYRLTGAAINGAALTRSNQSLIVMGDGQQATQLIWQPSSGGSTDTFIQWSTTRTTTSYDRFEIHDITLRAERAIGNAIFATKSATFPPQVRQQALLENVEIISTPETAGYFVRGVYFEGLENCKMNGVTVGYYTGIAGTTGIEISSAAGATSVSMAQLHQIAVFNSEIGVKFSGYEQGLMLADSNICNCGIAVFTPLTPDGFPGLNIRGCHLSAWYVAIGIHSMVQAMITDNLIYLIPDNAHPQSLMIGVHTGVTTFGATNKDVTFSNNQILYVVPQAVNFVPTTWGVYVAATPGNETVLVAQNMFSGLTVGVQMDGGSNGAFVANTNRYRSCGTNVVNGGANTVQP